METISFNRKTLHDFIYSERFSQLENIPISKQRALSQINNPRIHDDDIILVAQFDENKTVGYLGILPDYVFIDDRSEKMGWLTCFWVHDDYKSHDVAANLFRRVIRAWEQKIFITNIVPWLEPVYQKTKLFKPTKYKTGLRGYLRFNLHEILPHKKNVFRRLSFLLKISDYILNLFVDLRLFFFKEYSLNLNYEYITETDDTLNPFISTHIKKSWNGRAAIELKWIMHFPWLIEGGTKDYNSSRYYFSSLSKRFFYQIVKFTDNSDNIKAIVLLNIRDNRLNVPYIFCEKESIDEISKFIINTMLGLKLNMITTFNDVLIYSIKKIKPPFLLIKTIKKPYFISKKFEMIEELNFQDGDGDCCFY